MIFCLQLGYFLYYGKTQLKHVKQAIVRRLQWPSANWKKSASSIPTGWYFFQTRWRKLLRLIQSKGSLYSVSSSLPVHTRFTALRPNPARSGRREWHVLQQTWICGWFDEIKTRAICASQVASFVSHGLRGSRPASFRMGAQGTKKFSKSFL